MNRTIVMGRRSAPGTLAVSVLLLLVMAAADATAQNPALEFLIGLSDPADTVNQGGAGGRAVAFDPNGRLYATGTFSGTVDFDPGAGTAQLTAASSPHHAYVACYDASGNYVWAFAFGGYDGAAGWQYNFGSQIAVAANDDIVVAGHFTGTVDVDPGPGIRNLTALYQSDMFIARYTPSGALIWAFSINADLASLAIDGNGDIAVTGSFRDNVDFDGGAGKKTLSSPSGAMYIAKYSGGGALRWAFKVEGKSSSSRARSVGLAIGASNSIWVTGELTGTVNFSPGGKANLTASGTDVFIARYSSAGAYEQAFRIGGTGNDYGSAIVADASGNVHVAGKFQSTGDFDPGTGTASLVSSGGDDIFLAKYSGTGGYLWAIGLGGGGNDYGYDVALDGGGDVHLAAGFTGTADFDPSSASALLNSSSTTGAGNAAVARYDANGVLVSAFSIAATWMSRIWDIDLDSDGTIAITGSYRGTADFDPSDGEASLVSAVGDAYIASYVPPVLPKRAQSQIAEGPGALVFPNPFAHDLTIALEAGLKSVRVEVVDVNGNLVETSMCDGSERAIRVGASLPAGTYMVRWNDDGCTKRAIARKIR